MAAAHIGQQSKGVSIRAESLAFSYGAKTVLDGASFTLDADSKSCLVGGNGVGKSTLLRILARELEPHGGQLISSNPRYEAAYVPQMIPHMPGNVGVLDFLVGHPAQVPTFARGAEPLPQSPQITRLGVRRSAAQRWGTDNVQRTMAEAKKGLSAFVGLHRGEEDTPVAALSGGQKTRLFFLRALTSQPDLLLLDEPDNNLDRRGRRWLIDSIRSYPRTVLAVGHRPEFIEHVAERILELSDRDHKVHTYACGYTTYLENRGASADADDKERLQVERERRRLGAAIQKQRRLTQRSHRGPRAPRDKDKIASKHKSARATKKHTSHAARLAKRLAALPQLEPYRPPELRIQIAPARCGHTVVVARKLSKSYERPLFHNFSIRVTRGQRIAILGPNASGKSTLLKMIAGLARPDEGEIRIGKGVVIGYFPQEQEGLPDNTVLEHLRRTVPLDITSLRRELHHYQLTEDEVSTNVRSLSAGERARLLLLQFALSHANLLLLDEPTNSLNPDSQGTLANSLARYGGSVLVVSHDHSFLERLSVDRILRVGDGAIRVEYGQEL